MTLQEFVSSRLYKIRGFMHPVDAFFFINVLADQARRSLPGCLAEIGVFYGRSFALLAKAAGDSGTKAVGIDLFDIRGQREYVDQMLAAQGLGGFADLIAQPSETVDAEQFLDSYGKVRLFHIDGGHERHHVMADFEFAMKVVADEHVVVFDDFMNAQYPDLSVAIIDILRENQDRLSAFAISKSKLYVCNKAAKAHYAGLALAGPMPPEGRNEQFRFLDEDIVFLNQPLLARAAYQFAASCGLGNKVRYLPLGGRQKFAR